MNYQSLSNKLINREGKQIKFTGIENYAVFKKEFKHCMGDNGLGMVLDEREDWSSLNHKSTYKNIDYRISNEKRKSTLIEKCSVWGKLKNNHYDMEKNLKRWTYEKFIRELERRLIVIAGSTDYNKNQITTQTFGSVNMIQETNINQDKNNFKVNYANNNLICYNCEISGHSWHQCTALTCKRCGCQWTKKDLPSYHQYFNKSDFTHNRKNIKSSRNSIT